MFSIETIRTVVCKLASTSEQRPELDTTLIAFADACNFIADVTRQIHSSNKVKVQRACYAEVRRRFGLSADLSIRAIARVCATMNIAAVGARVTVLEDAPSGKGEDALRRHSRASVKTEGDASPAVRYFSPRYDLRTTSLRNSAEAVSCNTISPLWRT
jgi:hypothetical protein